MKYIDLREGHTLQIRWVDKKVRLTVMLGDEALACRQERAKVLLDFLEAREGHLFKGRVQLYKADEEVLIELKGAHMGTLTATSLKRAIEEVRG